MYLTLDKHLLTGIGSHWVVDEFWCGIRDAIFMQKLMVLAFVYEEKEPL